MASELNIVKPGFTQCSAIYYGALPIAQVYKGGTLIWEKSSEVTYSILTPSYGVVAMAYTPSSDITLDQVTTYLNVTYTWGFEFAVYTYDSDTGYATLYYNESGSTGLTVDTTNTITVDSTTFYPYIKVVTTPPTLYADTTYYIAGWHRYASAKTISIDNDTSGEYIDIYEWEMTNSTVYSVLNVTGVTIKINAVVS